jgi:hypothetical protein
MGTTSFAHHPKTRHLSAPNQEKFQRLLAAKGLAGTAIALGSSVTMVERLDGGGGATSKGIARIATALAALA